MVVSGSALTAEESRACLTRVALGSGPLDSFFPAVRDGSKDTVTLSFVIAGHLLTAFCPADLEWSGYLTVLEKMYGAAAGMNPALLPALMLRSVLLGSPCAFGTVQHA